MSLKIVLLSSVRMDYPFQLGVYVKETDKSVFYNRLNHDPELDETYHVNRKNAYAIVDYSELYKLQNIQKEFSEKWWALEKERANIIESVKNI